MGAALGALVLVAPWLVWLPFVHGGAALDVLGAIAILGAWHGWGRAVALVARREAGTAITIVWGLAACVAVAGLAIALHIYDPLLLVLAGGVLHTLDGIRRWSVLRTLAVRRTWFSLAPALLVIAVACIAIVGAAGQVPAHALDDDGSVLAQIARLAGTGALGDAIGYPRMSQLGAHPALAALVSSFGDPTQGRLVDRGLGFALVLALACARINRRDAGGALWTTLLATVACALPLASADFAPLWIPAALVLGLDATLAAFDTIEGIGDARAQLPLTLLAGALAAVRTEYVPMALVFVLAAWWPGRRDIRRVLVLTGGFFVAVVPYALARTAAWHQASAPARAIIEPAHHALAHLLVFVAIAVAATPLALLVVHKLPGRSARVFAVACAVGVAGVTALGTRPFAAQLYWPIAIAAFVVLAIAVAPELELGAVTVVLALLACVLVRDAQAAGASDRNWRARVHDWFADVAYARHAAPEGGDYTRVLDQIPRGDTVAVWVARPELLDYARVHVIDLRTPRTTNAAAQLDRLVAASEAHWLLVEDLVPPPALDAVVHAHRVVATVDGVQLVDLH